MIGQTVPIAIERKRLFEQVFAYLEGQILSGALKPGDRLPVEREMQSLFGVGRPAIREALIALQRAGLIEISNGTSARVAMPTASGVLAGMMPAVLQMLSTADGQRHFQHVRMFFECGLARHAAQNARPDQIEALRQALASNGDAIGDRTRFIATDIGFHLVLAEIVENPVFVALHGAMSSWLKRQRTVTLERDGQAETAYRAHSAIFKAIASHDADAAESTMRDHLLQLQHAYWHQES